MVWSLLPNALGPFQDLLCTPEFRTWIHRLILLRALFVQAWGSLTSLKSQTRDPRLKVPPDIWLNTFGICATFFVILCIPNFPVRIFWFRFFFLGMKAMAVLLLCIMSSLADDKAAQCRDICSRAFVVCPQVEPCQEGYVPTYCAPDEYSCCTTCVKNYCKSSYKSGLLSMRSNPTTFTRSLHARFFVLYYILNFYITH